MKHIITAIALFFVFAPLADAQTPLYRLKDITVKEYDSATGRLGDMPGYTYWYSGTREGYLSGCEWSRPVLFEYDRTIFIETMSLKYDEMDCSRIYAKQWFDTSDQLIVRRQWGLSAISPYDSFSYDAKGNVLFRLYYGNFRNLYYYDTNGRLDSMHMFTSKGLTADEAYKYDAFGNLIEKQAYYINSPTEIYDILTKYEYDVYGRLIKMGWGYNPSTSSYVEEYFYDAAGDMYQTLLTDGSRVHQWDYTYDAQHRRMTEVESRVYSNPTTLNPLYKVAYSYNSFGFVSHLERKTWDVNKKAWRYKKDDKVLIFNYTLEWPTGINDISQEITNTLQAYPIPTANVLTVQHTFVKPVPFTMSITDMQGRVVRQWQEQPASEYQRTLPTTDLPAGNYVIQLQTKEEKRVSRFSVVR